MIAIWRCPVRRSNGTLPAWTEAYLDCYGDATFGGLTDASGVVINLWESTQGKQVFALNLPDTKDPKLVPVPRTRLEAGLYEFVIVRHDGTILRHFEEAKTAQYVSASFADFVGANVYPVPVTGKSFSIDFDLPSPMRIDIKVVNNVGTTYYTKLVDFPLNGRNKHVVNMGTNWPDGTYYCTFTYPDASIDPKSILIQNGD